MHRQQIEEEMLFILKDSMVGYQILLRAGSQNEYYFNGCSRPTIDVTAIICCEQYNSDEVKLRSQSSSGVLIISD
jgi:hypothetical protein